MSEASIENEQTECANGSGEFTGAGADIAATFSLPAAQIQANLERAAETIAHPAADGSEAGETDAGEESDAGQGVADEEPAAEQGAANELAVPAQRRITHRGMLHNVNGKLNHTGWMLEPLLRYDRSRVKASKLRLKEWDRYLINDDDYALVITVANYGYVGEVTVQLVNLVHPSSKTAPIVVPLPGRRIALPESSVSGVTSFSNRRGSFLCRAEDGRRRIVARFNDFMNGEALSIDALLDQEPAESLYSVLAWPEDDQSFHYRRIAPALRASGSFKVGRRVHGFSPTRSFGAFGWNRGLWPLEERHAWALAQGWQDGAGDTGTGTHKVGLQLMMGMDQSAASQNALFIDGHVIKLGDLSFEIPLSAKADSRKSIADRYNLSGAWHFRDADGRVDLQFTPAHDSEQRLDIKALCLDRHQVFGRYQGKAKVDGETFVIADLPGMALVEHARF